MKIDFLNLVELELKFRIYFFLYKIIEIYLFLEIRIFL